MRISLKEGFYGTQKFKFEQISQDISDGYSVCMPGDYDAVGPPSKLFSEVTRGWTSSGTAYFVMNDGTFWAAGSLTGAPESGNYPKIGR